MAEQSPQHVVNNDKSVGEPSPPVDVHASHQSLSLAAQGATHTQEHQPAESSKPSSPDLAHPNGLVNRELDNTTPDLHGSDTDSSRPDASKIGRSSSAKKPVSFKPVSITKSFLAKTATAAGPAAPVAKLPEKASLQPATLQPVAKPRLIAKTGSSGSRDLPRTRSGDGTSTPNGRTVWNKNQPVPPPPPKQFTDEELKQQYGIHLATRLQSDDATEQKSKWADIDEDEDDWAPETVEWMDGTKTTISHADAIAPPPEEKPLEKPVDEQPPVPKPTMTALKRPGLVAPTRTILRPGAAQQAKQAGTDGKATPDRGSPMVKTSAPAPIKSPWAPLPPVEKVSPIVVNPPSVPQPPPKFVNRDPHGFDALASQPLPAHEIATDTFDRSWREGERTHRELFNSQSGRYEPAPESFRRGSRQQDQFHRQPAVLQRPSPQTGPAEPSAAFQARTANQTDGSPWGRRRGSSIGGNALRDRRMSSTSKSIEANEAAPEAVVEVDAEVQQVQQPAQAPETPMSQTDGPSATVLSVTDERERQKKLMQEKREAAIRRKQEEEAREEAARKERIKKKLEALGMPLEKTPSQEKAVPTQPEAGKQSEMQPVDGLTSNPSPKEKAINVQPAAASAAEAPRLEEQPRTEAHVSAAKQLPPVKDKTIDPSLSFNQNPASITRPALKSLSSPQLPGLQQHSPNGPTRSPYQQSSLQGVSASSFSSPGDQKAQPARLPSISGTDSFATSPWGNSSMATNAAPGANVWGPPPTNNRHIGNGTFDAGYSSISPGSRQQSQNAPFPASFTRPYAQRISPKAFGQPSPAPSASMDQSYASLSNVDSRMNEPVGASALAGTSPLPEPARLAYVAPIAPPQKTVSRPQQQPQRDVSAWTNFAMNAQAREEAEAARVAAERAPRSPPQQRWTETFKQTRVDDDRWLNGGRAMAAKERTAHGDAFPPHKPGTIGQPMPAPQSPVAHQLMSPQPPAGEQFYMGGEGIVRLPSGPSNFAKNFGSPGSAAHTGVRLPPLTAYSGNVQPIPVQPTTPGTAPHQSRFFPSAMYGGSPPPEESDHPVCGGNVRHPHVNLPQPKPKVKLPPALPNNRPHPSPVTMPPRSVQSFAVGARPIVQNPDWQAKFNGLFGKAQVTTTTPPSPPKTPPKAQAPAPAVAPVSRMSADSVVAESATTVSLPRSPSPTRSVIDVVSKPGVDDIFNGELSFGSTPRVSVPRGVKYSEPPTSTAGSTPLRPNSRFHKSIETQSKEMLFIPDTNTHNITLRIYLPNSWLELKEIKLPRKNKGKFDSQDRKNSGRPNNRNKRNGSGNTVPGLPNAASPVKGVSSKSQDGPAPDSTTKTPITNNAASAATADGDAKKSAWVKVPRGRGSGYKPRA